MRSALRKTLKVSALVLGVLLVLVLGAALLVLFDKPLVRNILQGRLNAGEGLTARIGRLDYSFSPFRVSVESFELVREDAYQKVSVSVARLEAAGSFWKIVRGVKPALETIRADGLVFGLEQKAVSEEPFDLEKLLLQAVDTLDWTKHAAVTKTRLSVEFMGRRVNVGDLDLAMTPDPVTDLIAYSLGHGDFIVERLDGALVFGAGLVSSGRLGLVNPFSVDGEFSVASPRIPAAGIRGALPGADLALTARLEKSSQELAVSRARIAVPGLVEISGTVTGKLGHGLFLEAQARARLDDLEGAAALLESKLPPAVLAAAPRGRAALEGTYAVQRSDQGSKDNLAAAVSIDGLEIAPVVAGRRLHVRASGRIETAGPTRTPRLLADLRAALGPVTAGGLSVGRSDVRLKADARIEASGPVPEAQFSADLHAAAGPVAGAGFSIAGSDLRIVASGSRAAAEISRFDARLSRVAFEAAPGKTIAWDNAVLAASGSLDLVGRSAALTALEARLPALAPLRLSGRYGTGKNAGLELELESRGLDIPALRAAAGPFLPASLAGWDLGGTLDLSLSLRRPASPSGDWSLAGTAALAGARVNDPSFTVAGEGLDPVLTVEGARSAKEGLRFTAGLDIGHGESLWKSLYASWNKFPLKLTVAGRYDQASGAIEGLSANLFLADVGKASIKGRVRLAADTSFDLATEANVSLGPLTSLFAQAGASPDKGMQLEGTLSAALDVRKQGGAFAAGGRIKAAGVNFGRIESGTYTLGITADLPLRYESAPRLAEGPPASGSASQSEAALRDEGWIHVSEVRNPFLTLTPVDLTVRAGVNTWAIEPVALVLFGGRLELGRTILRLDPGSGGFSGAGSLALRDIDISRFPIQSPQFKLTGKIQADFTHLDISSRRIAVSGRGEASVFGGQIVLRDLIVVDPFVPGRSISLSLDLVDLDLKKLTNEVPFGEVTGIVRGEVRDLVIAYRQPESFFFRIESVPRRGVPQTFSLKAVDNLTVLSSGQQASGGTGNFWMSFIRGFRYRKLGIVSTLRNDTFTLNGTIHEGGIEYLVKKPALFGISVVNREPEKSISFKEMTSRLARVGQSEK